MEIKLVLLLYCLHLFACNQKSNLSSSNAKTRKEAFVRSEILSDPFIGKEDSTITNFVTKEVYYKYKFLTDSTYEIHWGNRVFASTDINEFKTLGNGNLSLIDYNNCYIILGQGTGTNSNIRVVLPLRKGRGAMVFENVIYENLARDIILRAKEDSNALIALNYETNRTKEVQIDNFCPAVDFVSCIDSVSTRGLKIFIYYQGDKWQADRTDKQIKAIDIPR